MGFPVNHIVEVLDLEGDDLTILAEDIKNPLNAEKVKALAELVHQSHDHFSEVVSMSADRFGSKVRVKTFIILQSN